MVSDCRSNKADWRDSCGEKPKSVLRGVTMRGEGHSARGGIIRDENERLKNAKCSEFGAVKMIA